MVLTNEEKLQHAQTRKEEGNEAFKQGRVKDALRAYHELPDNWLRDLQAVLHLSGIEAGSGSQNALSTALSGGDAAQKLITDEQDPFKKEVRTQLSLCYSNLAAGLIKEEKWGRAIDNCDKALQKDETNKKARFRRAQSLISMKEHTDLDKAKADLDILAKAEPNDPAVRRERARLREREKAADLKQRKEFAGMFDRYAQAEEKAEKEAEREAAKGAKEVERTSGTDAENSSSVNVVIGTDDGIVGEDPSRPKLEEIE